MFGYYEQFTHRPEGWLGKAADHAKYTSKLAVILATGGKILGGAKAVGIASLPYLNEMAKNLPEKLHSSGQMMPYNPATGQYVSRSFQGRLGSMSYLMPLNMASGYINGVNNVALPEGASILEKAAYGVGYVMSYLYPN